MAITASLKLPRHARRKRDSRICGLAKQQARGWPAWASPNWQPAIWVSAPLAHRVQWHLVARVNGHARQRARESVALASLNLEREVRVAVKPPHQEQPQREARCKGRAPQRAREPMWRGYKALGLTPPLVCHRDQWARWSCRVWLFHRQEWVQGEWVARDRRDCSTQPITHRP